MQQTVQQAWEEQVQHMEEVSRRGGRERGREGGREGEREGGKGREGRREREGGNLIDFVYHS